MNPLVPPTVTTLFITTLLVLVCHHMYRKERDKTLLIWTLAWVVFFFRQIGALAAVYQPGTMPSPLPSHTSCSGARSSGRV